MDEKSKCSPRDSRLKIACLMIEDEGEDDLHAERSVILAGKGLGNIDGTRAVSWGREHRHRLDSQAEKLFGSSQILSEGQGSGHVLDPGMDLCRVLGSSPGLGLNSQATLCSDSIKRARLNGFVLHEPPCLKARAEFLKTRTSQKLFSRPVETSERLEPILSSSEAEKEGIVSSHGEEDVLSKVAAQAEGHKIKKRYDDNFFAQSISIPFSVFGRPLLPGGSSSLGESLMEEALPLRIVGSDGREWISVSPVGISDEGEETNAVS